MCLTNLTFLALILCMRYTRDSKVVLILWSGNCLWNSTHLSLRVCAAHCTSLSGSVKKAICSGLRNLIPYLFRRDICYNIILFFLVSILSLVICWNLWRIIRRTEEPSFLGQNLRRFIVSGLRLPTKIVVSSFLDFLMRKQAEKIRNDKNRLPFRRFNVISPGKLTSFLRFN